MSSGPDSLGVTTFPEGIPGHTTYEGQYTGPEHGWTCECGARKSWATGTVDPHEEWLQHVREVK